jgi:hypothetical protein
VGSSASGERPLRAQLVVALVVGLILLAVPLYLWRRPGRGDASSSEAASAAASTPLARSASSASVADAGGEEERVKLATVQRIKCSASPAARGQEGSLCDALPPIEQALAKAIRDSADCAPKTGKEGTINYVLKVDFAQRTLHVFPGASGSWKGPQARRAATCVKRALSAPSWDAVQHQYAYYSLAILATYAPPNQAFGTGGPLFE